MARSDIPIELVSRAGVQFDLNETTPSEADDAMFPNDGQTFLLARNTGAGTHVVTFVTQQAPLGLALADLTVSVLAGKTMLIGPFPTEQFNVQSGADLGKVYVNVDGTGVEMRYKAHRL